MSEPEKTVIIELNGVSWEVPQSLWMLVSAAVTLGVAQALEKYYTNCPMRPEFDRVSEQLRWMKWYVVLQGGILLTMIGVLMRSN